MQTQSSLWLDKRLHFPFLKKGAMPSAANHPPVHNCTLKIISNRREQPAWAAGKSQSTIPVFRNTKSSTSPGVSCPTSWPTTKAKKDSGSSGNGWLIVKRKRRKERQGKSKQVTAQGAASLAAPFLMQKALLLTHFGGEKAADRKASWTTF